MKHGMAYQEVSFTLLNELHLQLRENMIKYYQRKFTAVTFLSKLQLFKYRVQFPEKFDREFSGKFQVASLAKIGLGC